MYQALESAKDQVWVPDRLSLDLDNVCIVHVSGELKTWSRDPLGLEFDDAFAERLLRDNSSRSHSLWSDRLGKPDEYAVYGLGLVGSDFLSLATGLSVGSVVECGVHQVRRAACLAVKKWREDLDDLQSSYPVLPQALSDLMRRLSDSSVPS